MGATKHLISGRRPSNHEQAPLPPLTRRIRLDPLKKWYGVLFEVGLCLSLISLVGLSHVDVRVGQTFEIPDVAPAVVKLEDIAQTEHIERPPPPPRPAPPIQVPDESILEDEILEIDAEIDIDAPVELPPPPPPLTDVPEYEPEIFVVVEEMPVLIGGMEHLQELIAYPELAAKAGIEGLVVVTFVVEPDGSISGAEVIKSAGALLDNAAMEAVAKLEFLPGKQRGKPVRVRFSLPVRFRIKKAHDVM